MPMLRNGSLNQLNVGLCDGPCPDGNGQHSHHKSEINRGRHKKMHRPEKNWRQVASNKNWC